VDSLPVIDLTPLRDGTDPDSVAAALDAACTDLGFFSVVGHHVTADLQAAMFEQARRFFALPLEQKMSIAIANSKCHSGYIPAQAETLDDALGGDNKEALDIGTDRGPDHPQVRRGTPLHGPAQWPAALLPEFRTIADDYARACLDTNDVLMSGMALALGLDVDHFRPKYTDPISSVRLIRYPRVADAAPGDLGAGAHTDYGSLTLLAQDTVGGLQVRKRDGGWLDVLSPPGALIVNIGDMFARWTNHRYVSTLHRVVQPTARDRYSIPYFLAPDFHATVEAIPSCVPDGEQPLYPPISAGAYMLERFGATHDYLKSRETSASPTP
jgi:isopenicillin N synthase-like dioxygenase